jgi:hypothetical protein
MTCCAAHGTQLKVASDNAVAKSFSKEDWAYLSSLPVSIRIPGLSSTFLKLAEGLIRA